MPVLEAPKDELFCQEIINQKGNIAKAYLTQYPDASPKNAYFYAWRKLQHLKLKERLSELLEKQGAGIIKLNHLLGIKLSQKKAIQVDDNKRIMYVDDSAVQMDALKLGYKLHGLINENQAPVNIDQSQHLTIEAGADPTSIGEIVGRLEKLKERSLSSRVHPVIDVRSIEIEPEQPDAPQPITQPPSTLPSVTSDGTTG